MNSRKLYTILAIIELCVFAVATVFVMVFQFSGTLFFIALSLGTYVVGFAMVAITHAFGLYDTCQDIKHIKKDSGEKSELKIKELSRNRIWEIVRLVLATCFTIFTFVVFILYVV